MNGVGLLHQAVGARHALGEIALVYAENGRGKSTVSAILRSVASGDVGEVTSRKTIDGTNDQLIKLQFQSGQRATFQNGTWDCTRPELLVFDAHFINRNVYSGAAVSSDQRRNLLDFAIGDSAVAARLAEQVAVDNHQRLTGELATLNAQVEGLAGGMSIAAFEGLTPVADLDAKRVELERLRTDAMRSEAISNQPAPSRLTLVDLDLAVLFDVLKSELADIERSAEEVVEAHLASLPGHKAEEWVSEGLTHQGGDECPFCAQPTAGIELVRMYRTYFNLQYLSLKERIARSVAAIEESTGPATIERLRAERATINSQIASWAPYKPLEPLGSEGDSLVADSVDELRRLLLGLFAVKAEHPGESVGDDQGLAEARAIIAQALSPVVSQNDLLDAHEISITEFKASLAAVDAEVLAAEITKLTLAETRFKADTVSVISDLRAARTGLAAAERAKRDARDELSNVMAVTLGSYGTSINNILANLGAAFSIERLSNNFRGGAARSEYEISLRGQAVQLSGGEPTFETALSEGDKRTLAFAFFMASALGDTALSRKTVIIDDPVSSLDRHRRESTIEVLQTLADSCEQLIVLAHDAVFLRSARDAFNKPAPRLISETQIRRGGHDYSDFDSLDLDRECETPFYTNYRIVEEFIAGAHHDGRTAATALRPLVEGHLHRRFPGLIAEGRMLGQSITEIEAAVVPSPLALMSNWAPEMRRLNTFAGKFHHDTNPGYATELVQDADVLSYALRVMNLVHGGPVPGA